ncbi:MAG: TolC family protein [Candidatus Korobacteraceae bacterium]
MRVQLLLLVTLLLCGCTVRRYQALPIVPGQSASRLEARNFADPGMRAYVEKNLGHSVAPWPPKTWDLRTLSLAALYFHPSVEAARARLAEAEAAILTAGARPNPSLSIAPGVPSPWLLNLDFAVPIETAGKRGHRIQSARSLNQAALLDLADAAWKVRSGVRLALLNCVLASRNLDALRAEEELRAGQVKLLEQRLTVGEIARPEVDAARIELSKTHLAIAEAEGKVSESRAALAASMTVPTASLDGMDFAWAELDSPPAAESLSPAAIQRDAVLDRLDVRRALAQYAAAEADLQLEIAKQYPDLQIGPGYTYEEGHSYFTLGLSATLPVFNRNQGPIAEAEARRREVAAAFVEKQTQVIAESETSLARYVSALQALAEAGQSLRTLQDTQLQRTQRAVQLGEEDRLTLYGVEIEHAVVLRGRLDALARAQSALGELEDAVERPLDPGDVFSAAPESLPPSQLKEYTR